jgi:hypothetical protein
MMNNNRSDAPAGGVVAYGDILTSPTLPNHSHSIPSQGGSQAHSIVQPTILLTIYIKL